MLYLAPGQLLHVDGQVVGLQPDLGLLLVQLLFGSLQRVDLLAELGHRVRVLLPQGGGRHLVVKPRLLQLPPHLLEVCLPLPVDMKYLWGHMVNMVIDGAEKTSEDQQSSFSRS